MRDSSPPNPPDPFEPDAEHGSGVEYARRDRCWGVLDSLRAGNPAPLHHLLWLYDVRLPDIYAYEPEWRHYTGYAGPQLLPPTG